MQGRHSPRRPIAQKGIALVITLVLLLVMTMIAVVAMRTTTVDLKMTTNTVLQRRAFQNSEGARTAIRRMLSAHMFNRGWPPSAGGSGTGEYDIPIEVQIVNLNAHFDSDENGKLADLGPPTFSRNPDIRYRRDVNNNAKVDADDMFADIWVTYLKVRITQGGSAEFAGDTTSAHTFLDVRARGDAPGNAQIITGAEYRALVKTH